MQQTVTTQQLLNLGVAESHARDLEKKVNSCLMQYTAEDAWQIISKTILTPHIPFSLHLYLFKLVFPDWPDHPQHAPAYIPPAESVNATHLKRAMNSLHFEQYRDFHAWSCDHYQDFWLYVIKQLNIKFHTEPNGIINDGNKTKKTASPHWFPHATLNIVESCFSAKPDKTAILYKNEKNLLQKISYGELNTLSNRIANSLVANGYVPGDAIAINMPMNYFAVAIYLGIIKMGGVVVSIADSFSSEEIATRLRIAHAKAIFTQDVIVRNAKKLELYNKVIAANAPPAIVLSANETLSLSLRSSDSDWDTFLVENNHFHSHPVEPMSHCNILFSSGTTGDPKAIPWNHTTAIKAASDAYFHHNIQPDDILAWPTNLGWMMGPWLIFAAFINQASIALYDGVPHQRAFGEFIAEAKVTMLGVVPTLVAHWRQSQCMEGLDWQAIKLFSSTGECSNPEDMLYLMSLAGYKPIIEYCGGTEIGGSYITSTLIEKNYPSIFTTPALGLNFILLDDSGIPCDNGEVAIVPPSLGLSTELLNADHHQIYFAHMPTTPDGKILRRHGDQVRRFENGFYSILGRADDTMNLGGIKVSSAEIERVLVGTDNIIETAAIAVSLQGKGPSQLVIFAVATQDVIKKTVQENMQKRINQHLNPLFKIYDIVFIRELPKTASNKIMRRVLRKQYSDSILK